LIVFERSFIKSFFPYPKSDSILKKPKPYARNPSSAKQFNHIRNPHKVFTSFAKNLVSGLDKFGVVFYFFTNSKRSEFMFDRKETARDFLANFILFTSFAVRLAKQIWQSKV
jgi:hypothetical protein